METLTILNTKGALIYIFIVSNAYQAYLLFNGVRTSNQDKSFEYCLTEFEKQCKENGIECVATKDNWFYTEKTK